MESSLHEKLENILPEAERSDNNKTGFKSIIYRKTRYCIEMRPWSKHSGYVPEIKLGRWTDLDRAVWVRRLYMYFCENEVDVTIRFKNIIGSKQQKEGRKDVIVIENSVIQRLEALVLNWHINKKLSDSINILK